MSTLATAAALDTSPRVAPRLTPLAVLGLVAVILAAFVAWGRGRAAALAPRVAAGARSA